MAGKNADKETMSVRDMELMAHALKSIKGDVTIDYDKFAELAGLKNKSVASVTWGRLKRKLDRVSAVDTPDTTLKSSDFEDSPIPAKKTTVGKRKARSTCTNRSKKPALELEPNTVGIKPEPTSEGEGSDVEKEESDEDEF